MRAAAQAPRGRTEDATAGLCLELAVWLLSLSGCVVTRRLERALGVRLFGVALEMGWGWGWEGGHRKGVTGRVTVPG